MKYDHVGRPTNEEVSHRKRIVFLKILIPIIIIVVLVFVAINSNIYDYFKDNIASETNCLDDYYLKDGKCIKDEEIDASLLGDVTQDGIIDSKDIDLIKKMALKKVSTDEAFTSADINRDSAVDLLDYNELNDYIDKKSSNSLIGTYVCPMGEYQLEGQKCLYTTIQSKDSKKQYKVIYHSNGGIFADTEDTQITQKVYEKESLKLPSVTKKGYEFKGWYLGNKKVSDHYKVKKNMKLKAKWAARSDKVTITFDGNGGDVLKHRGKVVGKLKVKKVYNNRIGNLPKVKRNGYKFKGWYIKDKKISINTKVTDEVVIKAKWSPKKYKLKLVTRHGKLKKKTITVKHGSKISNLPALKSTDSLEFLGWYTNKDGKGRQITNDTVATLTKNATLYAYWARN